MRFYATTTSERASKGQGGNEYIFINIQDERKVSFGFIALQTDDKNFYPVMKVFSHGKLEIISGYEMQEIQNQTELKGNKKKDWQKYQEICNHKWYKPYINEDTMRCAICGLDDDTKGNKKKDEISDDGKWKCTHHNDGGITIDPIDR